MTRGGNKVQAAVDPIVRHLSSVDTGLSVQEVLKLIIDVVDNWLPTATEEKGVKKGREEN